MEDKRGIKESTTRRRSVSEERKVSYSQLQSGSSPAPEEGEEREEEIEKYAPGERRRDRAGRSESARAEREASVVESSEEGRREERRWMRERALEMDSHQECMGSLLLIGAPPFWWWWLDVEGV